MSKYEKKYHGNVGEVYWKILKSYRTDLFTVACLQWFDEADYDEDRFVRNSNDEVHVFESEELAVQKLNEWYKPEEIDSEYRKLPDLDIIRD